jgi:hypothetical protein
MAGNVDYLVRTDLAQQLQQGSGTTLSWRVEQNGSFSGLKAGQQYRQEILGCAGQELTIEATACRGVLLGRFDREPIIFHSGERFHKVSQFDAEETHTAIDVGQVPGAAIVQALARDLHQHRQEEEVVLKKRVRGHLPPLGRNAKHNFESALGRRMRAHV